LIFIRLGLRPIGQSLDGPSKSAQLGPQKGVVDQPKRRPKRQPKPKKPKPIMKTSGKRSSCIGLEKDGMHWSIERQTMITNDEV